MKIKIFYSFFFYISELVFLEEKAKKLDKLIFSFINMMILDYILRAQQRKNLAKSCGGDKKKLIN